MTPTEARVYSQVLRTADAVAREIAAHKTAAVHVILFAARRDSVAALEALRLCNPHDPAEIMRLQNEANLFWRMVEAIKATIVAGDDAAAMLGEVDKAELAELILDKEGVSDA